MYLTHLAAPGLRHHPSLEPLDRRTPLPAGPAAVAVADAARLLRVALRPHEAAALAPMGWAPSGEPLLDDDTHDVLQLRGFAPTAIESLLDDPDARSIEVEVAIAPDPPLYGRLREHALRDPRLVAALGEEASLHIKAGLLFDRAHRDASPDLLGARMGDVAFPIAGKERPSWLPKLLADLAGRIVVVDLDEPIAAVVARLEAAATSHRADVRAQWARAEATLQAVPFALPAPRWLRDAQGTPTLAFGDDLVSLRHLGRPAAEALRLVEAALLRTPDVLVLGSPVAPEVRAWLEGCTEGDDATLEQVLAP